MGQGGMRSRDGGTPLRRATRAPGAHPPGPGAGANCPECAIDLRRGRMNRSCATCARLHADHVRLRDWLYVHGAHDPGGLSAGSGVPLETISRLVALGYLRAETAREDDGGPPADACEVCRTRTLGTALCDPCRGRFVDDWQSWLDARHGPAHGAPAPVPAGDPDHIEVRPIRIRLPRRGAPRTPGA